MGADAIFRVAWSVAVVDWWFPIGLNINNEATHRLAREPAQLTGGSMTAAVTEVVRERLARLRRERTDGRADRLLAIGRDCAARLKEPYRSADHADLLYDERGLPLVIAIGQPVGREKSAAATARKSPPSPFFQTSHDRSRHTHAPAGGACR